MDRAQHLEFCRVCTNRKFDTSRGLVCSLTDALADFESECPEYILDIDESVRLKRKQEERSQKLEKEARSVSGLSAKAILWVGLMFLTVGVFWIITSQFYAFLKGYYAIIPIAMGLFVIAYGMNKRVAEMRAEKQKSNTPT